MKFDMSSARSCLMMYVICTARKQEFLAVFGLISYTTVELDMDMAMSGSSRYPHNACLEKWLSEGYCVFK